jgi:hypothetical protein
MDLFDHAALRTAKPFPIERGIPIPQGREYAVRATWERPDFDFAGMEVGDSFCVWPHQCGDAPLIVVQNMVSGAAATFCKKHLPKRKFTTRQIQGQYVRCWRLI